MRLRYSLRRLFLATIIAALCSYWFMLPTINARQFVRSVAAANFEHADSYFRSAKDRFLSDLNEQHWRFHARTELEPWSFRQFIRGRRLLRLYVAYGDAGPIQSQGYTVVVTRAGLLSPSPMVGGGFGGGGGGGIASYYLNSGYVAS
jgi:hypothetical protein